MSEKSTTPSSDDTPCQSTPPDKLRELLMDPCRAKGEIEWFASRAIERLETELTALQSAHDAMKVELDLSKATAVQRWIDFQFAIKHGKNLTAQLAAVTKERDQRRLETELLTHEKERVWVPNIERLTTERDQLKATLAEAENAFRLMESAYNAAAKESDNLAQRSADLYNKWCLEVSATENIEQERDRWQSIAEDLLQACEKFDGVEPIRLACENAREIIKRLKGEA